MCIEIFRALFGRDKKCDREHTDECIQEDDANKWLDAAGERGERRIGKARQSARVRLWELRLRKLLAAVDTAAAGVAVLLCGCALLSLNDRIDQLRGRPFPRRLASLDLLRHS